MSKIRHKMSLDLPLEAPPLEEPPLNDINYTNIYHFVLSHELNRDSDEPLFYTIIYNSKR